MRGTDEERAFRVLTLNVRTALGLDGRHAWPFRRSALVEALREIDADVLCLQEVLGCQARYLRRRLGAGWDARGTARGRWGFGERCLVLARTELFEVAASSTRWFGDRPGVAGSRLAGASHPRVATSVVLRHLRTGRDVGVANAHLDAHDEQRRLRSAHQLLGWVDDARPWVVAGDLNSRPTSSVLAVLAEAGYRDTLTGTGQGTAHRFTGSMDGPRLDYVLTSAALEVRRAWIATPRPAARLISDHWPVVADLRIPDTRDA